MARDKYHNIVKQGLIEEGWTITDNPLYIELFTTTLEIDLGAERLIGATKGNHKIAIEVKSFVSLSRVSDFYKALGQFNYYHVALEHTEPERTLYLALPQDAYVELIKEPITTQIMNKFKIKFIIYDVLAQKIVKWIE